MRSAHSLALAKHALRSGMMRAGAFAPFRLLNRRAGLILKYHRFSDAPGPATISRGALAEHLRYLDRRYTLVSMAAMAGHLRAGTPTRRPLAAITIDDGHADAYEVAFPVLRQLGVPATLYVVTGFLDRTCWLWTDQVRYAVSRTRRPNVFLAPDETLPIGHLGAAGRLAAAAHINERLKRLPEADRLAALHDLTVSLEVEVPRLAPPEYSAITWDQAREMRAAGVSIEPHTVTHPILTTVPIDALRREVIDSKVRVEQMMGDPAVTFCYPNGWWRPEVREAVEAAGFAAAVTTAGGFNLVGCDPFALKRQGADEALDRLVKATSGFDEWEQAVWQTGARLLRSRAT